MGEIGHTTHSWAKGPLLLHQIIFNNPLLLVQRIKKEKKSSHIETSLKEHREISQHLPFFSSRSNAGGATSQAISIGGTFEKKKQNKQKRTN